MAPAARERLAALLRSWSAERGRPDVEVAARSVRDGIVREELRLIPSDREPIPATLLAPEDAAARPAILYAHAHGHRHDIGRRELMEGRPALHHPPYGPILARLGYVVLCLDMPCFGDRQDNTEGAAAKARLWQGGTLMGDMLSDLATGLELLAARAEVDAARIGALGISMGATHAYWLAALDPRVACVAHLCAFASLRHLVETGAHDLHAPYLTVPGLLAEMDVGEIAGLVAPRPQLVCAGLADPLTPAPAFASAWGDLARAYGEASTLHRVVDPASAHVETPRMRRAVLAFFNRYLKP
ncbi:MAG: dienelactone hydrolase family protein [Pseudomonadota bacterium]